MSNPKFKVGDRVVCKVTYEGDHGYKKGNLGTITRAETGNYMYPYVVVFDNTGVHEDAQALWEEEIDHAV